MSRPIRVQLSRQKGWRMPPNTVKVDRTTPFGNPFKVGQPARIGGKMQVVPSAAAAKRHFKLRLLCNPELRQKIRARLRGLNLACWCPLDGECHADVLLEVANE